MWRQCVGLVLLAATVNTSLEYNLSAWSKRVPMEYPGDNIIGFHINQQS